MRSILWRQKSKLIRRVHASLNLVRDKNKLTDRNRRGAPLFIVFLAE